MEEPGVTQQSKISPKQMDRNRRIINYFWENMKTRF